MHTEIFRADPATVRDEAHRAAVNAWLTSMHIRTDMVAAALVTEVATDRHGGQARELPEFIKFRRLLHLTYYATDSLGRKVEDPVTRQPITFPVTVDCTIPPPTLENS